MHMRRQQEPLLRLLRALEQDLKGSFLHPTCCKDLRCRTACQGKEGVQLRSPGVRTSVGEPTPHQCFTSQPLRICSGREHQEPGENAPGDPPPARDGACIPQLFLHWGRVPSCFCARGGHPRVQLQAARLRWSAAAGSELTLQGLA